MSTIGLVRQENGTIKGRIATLTMAINFELVRNPQYRKDDGSSPSLLVVTKGPDGSQVRIGAAWPKLAKAGPRPGEKFYSLTIDDPSFDAPLNATLFKAGEGTYDVVWRRARRAAAAVADAGAGDGDGETAGEPVDDEIPF